MSETHTPTRWQQSILAQWDESLSRQASRAEEIAAGLTDEDLVRRPGEGRWSVAHCLEHLATTITEYRPFLEGAIAKREARGDREFPDYRPGAFARWFIGMAGPGKKALPAPKRFRPSDETANPDAVARFVSAVGEMRALLTRADAVNVNATKFRSPVTPLLRFRIGEGFDLVIQHNDRHLGQAERARAEVRG